MDLVDEWEEYVQGEGKGRGREGRRKADQARVEDLFRVGRVETFLNTSMITAQSYIVVIVVETS